MAYPEVMVPALVFCSRAGSQAVALADRSTLDQAALQRLRRMGAGFRGRSYAVAGSCEASQPAYPSLAQSSGLGRLDRSRRCRRCRAAAGAGRRSLPWHCGPPRGPLAHPRLHSDVNQGHKLPALRHALVLQAMRRAKLAAAGSTGRSGQDARKAQR